MNAILGVEMALVPEHSFEVSDGILPQFGDLIEDQNPIHRSREEAEKAELGFTNTPIFAIFQAAYAENILDSPLFSRRDNLFLHHSSSFKFVKPLYPAQQIRARIETPTYTEAGLISKLTLLNPGGEVSMKAEALFSPQPRQNHMGDVRNLRQVCNYDLAISRQDSETFYQLLGVAPTHRISNLQVAAGIPAALLKMIGRAGHSLAGVSRELDLYYHQDPHEGNFNFAVYLKSVMGKPERGYIYNFRSICQQDGQTILVGDMKVMHPQSILPQ
ncbi:MAG: MaoC family dehydratase [Nanoarchaeota archaeon]|nr:MaoC family dehydratase [Nanoarchaeota archaeon]